MSEFEAKVLQVIRSHPEVLLESLPAYEQQKGERQRQAQESLFQELEANPKSVIGESPATGAVEPKIVLLKFSDFQCPFCGLAQKTLEEFMARNADQVTLVFKNLPLSTIHSQAIPAAKAAWAADEQGKFWEYHDALFSQQNDLGEEFYTVLAQDLDLDLEQFNRDRNSERVTAYLEKDQDLVGRLGVTATPFLMMNGMTFNGKVSLSELKKAL